MVADLRVGRREQRAAQASLYAPTNPLPSSPAALPSHASRPPYPPLSAPPNPSSNPCPNPCPDPVCNPLSANLQL